MVEALVCLSNGHLFSLASDAVDGYLARFLDVLEPSYVVLNILPAIGRNTIQHLLSIALLGNLIHIGGLNLLHLLLLRKDGLLLSQEKLSRVVAIPYKLAKILHVLGILVLGCDLFGD